MWGVTDIERYSLLAFIDKTTFAQAAESRGAARQQVSAAFKRAAAKDQTSFAHRLRSGLISLTVAA